MGPGFESPEVHQRTKSAFITRGDVEETPQFIPDGIVGMNSEQGKQTNERRYKFLTEKY